MQMYYSVSLSAWSILVRRFLKDRRLTTDVGRYEDVVKFTEGKNEYQFERAYALYRLKQLPEALKLVRSLPKSARAQSLEAQIVHTSSVAYLTHCSSIVARSILLLQSCSRSSMRRTMYKLPISL